eukprot:9089-Eustigmatos_ZCMA.PRE.1
MTQGWKLSALFTPWLYCGQAKADLRVCVNHAVINDDAGIRTTVLDSRTCLSARQSWLDI